MATITKLSLAMGSTLTGVLQYPCHSMNWEILVKCEN